MDKEERAMRDILSNSRTIAVVGLSSRSDRPSYGVAAYLQRHGYRIVPVNPQYAGTQILGEPCFATLHEAKLALDKEGVTIDVVDCFRKSAQVGAAVDEAIAIGAPCVWMQLGIVDEAAAARARQADMAVVMDKCIKIEHMQLL